MFMKLQNLKEYLRSLRADGMVRRVSQWGMIRGHDTYLDGAGTPLQSDAAALPRPAVGAGLLDAKPRASRCRLWTVSLERRCTELDGERWDDPQLAEADFTCRSSRSPRSRDLLPNSAVE